MSTTFVRKDFYVEPPKEGSSIANWNKWLVKDEKAAIVAKRQFTRSLVPCDLPESAQESSLRRINGVWKQTTSIGLSGSISDGTATLEPIVEATQEIDLIRASFEIKKRGKQNLESRSDKRKDKRNRRKARKQGF